MKKSKIRQWTVANILFILMFFLMGVFALADYWNIQTFHEVNTHEAWNLYAEYTSVAMLGLWITLIVVPVIIYWLFTRDASESLGLLFAGLIMLFFAVEDVLFFLLTPAQVSNNMCWFNNANAPVAKFSEILGHECVRAMDLFIFAALGVVLAYLVYALLKRVRFKRFKWF